MKSLLEILKIVTCFCYHPNSDISGNTATDLLGEELHCRTCLTSFANKEDYRIHYRDDWHKYNLKSKLRDRPPVSQDEFFAIEGDISSISGSESEEESSSEEILAKSVGSPKVFFKNKNGQEMALYRCLLHPKKVLLHTSFCFAY